MATDTYIWLAALTLCLGGLGRIFFLMVRQIAYLAQTESPLAARQETVGPEIGQDLSGSFGSLLGRGKAKLTLVMFGATGCAVCRHLKGQPLEKVLHYWRREADFVVAYDEEEQSVPAELKAGSYRHLFGLQALRESLGIDYVPYTFVMDGQMRVLAKGLVNNLSHFESLLEAAREKTL